MLSRFPIPTDCNRRARSQKGLRSSFARLALLLTTMVMFGLSTAYVVLFVTFFKIQFPTLTSESVPDNPDWLIAKELRLDIALLVMRRVSVSLEDLKCLRRYSNMQAVSH